eukprot:2964243-Karenia_brevis.AAC.1
MMIGDWSITPDAAPANWWRAAGRQIYFALHRDGIIPRRKEQHKFPGRFQDHEVVIYDFEAAQREPRLRRRKGTEIKENFEGNCTDQEWKILWAPIEKKFAEAEEKGDVDTMATLASRALELM